MARKFIRKPWIQNVLLSENLETPVPKKVKARVLLANRGKNPDGTHFAKITDYERSILVMFSEEAVLECLKDKAHGNFIKHFADISGCAVVLTDHQVVPMFDKQVGTTMCSHHKYINMKLPVQANTIFTGSELTFYTEISLLIEKKQYVL